MFDIFGREVDYLIEYSYFEDKFLSENNFRNCHSFGWQGFLFDEISCYGFYDCKVGFKTFQDWLLYVKWYKRNYINNKIEIM